MFKKSAAAYSISVDEMKLMRDVLSTQETQPYCPFHTGIQLKYDRVAAEKMQKSP